MANLVRLGRIVYEVSQARLDTRSLRESLLQESEDLAEYEERCWRIVFLLPFTQFSATKRYVRNRTLHSGFHSLFFTSFLLSCRDA